LNKPINNLVTKAIPEFRFKQKALIDKIKLNFENLEDHDLANRLESPTKSIMSNEPDLSSSKRSEKDSSLPLKQMQKKYSEEFSQSKKEEEFKK